MGKKKAIERGVRYEKAQAKKHRGRHIGGPGKPDYKRGETKGEVKNWKQKVHSGVIKKANRKGVKEIISKSGFTKPAKILAKKKGIKLISRRK